MKTDKNVKHLFDIWKERVEELIKKHPLQIVSWEATRRCNLRCVHCGSPSEEVALANELTTEEVINAFEEIANNFDMSQFRHINITGGEPFIRNDLLKILKSISKHPFYRNIDIQTNGIFIDDNPGVLKELKEYGVTGLGISIDGLEETHDSFRQRKGTFAKAFKAASLSVENGYVVTVSVVAHSRNIEEIPKLFELTKKEIQPRVFRVMIIDPIGRAEFDSEYLLSSENSKKIIKFLSKEYKRSCSTYADPRSTMVELGCGGWLGRDLEGTLRPFVFHCIAGINNLGILYDGKLASCSNISRAFIEGDLRKEKIKDVWENKYQRYRNFEWKKIGDCMYCDQWEYCHGGPMHKRLSEGTMLNCIYKIQKKGNYYG